MFDSIFWGKKCEVILMEFKQLLDFSNAFAVSVIEAMEHMGLDFSLIWAQMAKTFEDKAKHLVEDAGIKIEGDTVQEISENFAKVISEVGLCQSVIISSATDDSVEVNLGECALSPATLQIRQSYPDIIPPCAVMAILGGLIEKKTGKHPYLESNVWKPESNACILKIKLE
jgi:hypothetical protein